MDAGVVARNRSQLYFQPLLCVCADVPQIVTYHSAPGAGDTARQDVPPFGAGGTDRKEVLQRAQRRCSFSSMMSHTWPFPQEKQNMEALSQSLCVCVSVCGRVYMGDGVDLSTVFFEAWSHTGLELTN